VFEQDANQQNVVISEGITGEPVTIQRYEGLRDVQRTHAKLRRNLTDSDH
jgi:hypothetical protein